MTILMFHLEFSKKERTYISIGKTNIGVIPVLKNSLELVNIVIKSSKYFCIVYRTTAFI